ncbi:phospholipase D family protein [Myxococcus sp. XM-1-1-1]|uniref:phospholipase D family protein n=1 Tax=Myxococcus sp. XM-1-1-1 TaxID=2874602 RepID=UPI001CC01269|nr:phospholipase D family protein [Myxococcus sp. XM-1-1-1]MBZ4414814.1 phospholipase D family protein [Myxococcus sp. XM-1-1-1]
MPLQVSVLFDRPQQEIASLLKSRLQQASRAWIVSGFATVEGIEAIAPPILTNPAKLEAFVIGAGTFRGYESMDRLLAGGVAASRLFVHLGHTRRTTKGAAHRFYRYHPMLHSKVYLLEMPDKSGVAFVGSHNVTGYALLGLNGEAGIMLEGPMRDPEMQRIKAHIDAAQAQSVVYSPSMKDALTWWTSSFIDGMRGKVNDAERDSEFTKTIVILAAEAPNGIPATGDVVYFEIPAALRQLRALDTEVHIYIFQSLPATPNAALLALAQAKATLWCRVLGIEVQRGGVELQADWHIANRTNPTMLRAPQPFRPKVARDMQQVRVSVRNAIYDQFEYLFDSGKATWVPILNENQAVEASPEDTRFLASLNLVPPEDKPWYLVRGLAAEEKDTDGAYQEALRTLNPESGSYVLMSLRRRNLTKLKRQKEHRGDNNEENGGSSNRRTRK